MKTAKAPSLPSRDPVREIRVEADRAGQRIDNFLILRLKGLPRSRVYQMLRRGEVRVNGRRIKQHYRLCAGDLLRIPPSFGLGRPRPQAPPASLLEHLESCVIYEDAGLLVVNKPSGIAVHGGSGRRHGVIEALRASRPKQSHLELVHRLDRDTSGALIVAKKRSVLKQLHTELREGRMDKRYLALLRGSWRSGMKTVRTPLKKNVVRSGERVVRADPSGKSAETKFLRVDACSDASLVEAVPTTGRTHQIRVHAAEIGHHVAGDPKYGNREFNRLMRQRGLHRMFLHASQIAFSSPAAERHVRIVAPLDEQLLGVLEHLGLATSF
jgi:23S rRNA pseudouridine955/2504/2580 synthase